MPSAASRSRASPNGMWWSSARLSTVRSAGSNLDGRFRGRGRDRNVRPARPSCGTADDIFRRADQNGQRRHRHRLDAGFAQAGDRQRAGTLGQPLARWPWSADCGGRRPAARRPSALNSAICTPVLVTWSSPRMTWRDAHARCRRRPKAACRDSCRPRAPAPGRKARRDRPFPRRAPDRSNGPRCARGSNGSPAKLGSRKRQCGLRPSASNARPRRPASASAPRGHRPAAGRRDRRILRLSSSSSGVS